MGFYPLGPVAQRLEQQTHNLLVVGSSPTRPTITPTWSSDGSRISFGSGLSDPTGAIRILDVRTNQISTLPDSKGYFSPRWSPDGRYIVAMPFQSRSLMLFDFLCHSESPLKVIGPGSHSILSEALRIVLPSSDDEFVFSLKKAC
jgi:hypothetical protein